MHIQCRFIISRFAAAAAAAAASDTASYVACSVITSALGLSSEYGAKH